jgi:ribosomal protein S18 acetylase RimI-like enzyme
MAKKLAWKAEHACLNAWPGLHNVVYDDWLIRFSEGLTRRANSVNALRPEAKANGTTIQLFENLFRTQGLALIFRVTSLLDASVDRGLEKLGFTAEGESVVLYADIGSVESKYDQAVDVLTSVDEQWLSGMNTMQKRTEEQSEIFDHIVLSIALPAGFATLRDGDEVVAQAYGVLHDDLLCCESVITSEAHRGQGVGRRLMSAMYAWAAAQGATGVCLQVDASNKAGLALYHGLGMTTELSRYHYRRQSSR